MSPLSRFHDPAWLWLLFLIPLLIWWRWHRGTGALRVSRLPDSAGGAWRLHVPFAVRGLAFALLVLALARPQLGYSWDESLTKGIDIQIALDISGSMAAEDFQPKNRLEVAKRVVNDFIDRRPADRIGLTIFSGAAMTRSPLTTDRRMLHFLVDTIELDSLPDGTAIGLGLANATARLKDSSAKSKVIVLVTDGVNNAGAIDPASATAIAKGLAVKVYTVGVGTAGRVYVPLPMQDPRTGRREVRRVLMDVEVDEELLRQIAERTGGRFFKASNETALREIFAEIDQLEKTEIATKTYIRYEEAFQPLVWGALALLLLPLLISTLNLTVEP
ncbi:MAG: VWA domain-containing protein [Acidobacteria bacterium]|nr:VWA domain-containing protein [Acidobacteriota bacterium]